ncbi:Bug family tripartite tricarboxylate transporter substrate binding protein [Bordetella tumulicola]|uniref:Bug family tripartite tricarboxylate transporter substrate binding protein n=1 Tax=Bordetella tumulicola TaxID=1649133 RepID=UPI0039EF9CE6
MIRKLFAVAAMTAACLVQAQDYPSKPIRIIIPSTPGGGTDFIGRLMGTKLQELNGWDVVPENKPGAGTALGLAEAARSPAQGYDLVIGQSDNVTLIPLLMKVTYDPIKDLAPVALVGTTPMVLLVSDKSPFKTLPDAIEAAKKAPDTISYGTSGTGGGVHMAMEMLQHEAGFKMQHVPYKGSSPALADLMGGHLQFAGSSISSAASLIKSGKVRALAVTSPKRNPALPDVPTVAELGYPDFSVVTFYGVLAPAKTPTDVLTRLNTDFNKLLSRKDVQDALASQGLEANPMSREQFAALIQADINKAKQTIKSAGIKVQ